jgi:hypothetical protein
MAEERSEGATTTEGPSVTSTVDANERLPRLGDAASDRYVGGGAGGLELATSLGDKLGKRNRAQVTLIEKARTHFCEAALHLITRRRYGRSGTVTHPSAIANGRSWRWSSPAC